MQSKKSGRSLIAASLCLVLAVVAAAQAVTIFPVATAEDDEAFPSVSGNTVVWQFYNSRYDDFDIAGADISNIAAPAGFDISDIPGDDFYPVIDGNDVVWQHHYRADSDGDVYGARIANSQRTSLYAISASTDDERMPYVSAGVAVWQHKFFGVSDWDVEAARLTGKDNPKRFPVSEGIDVDEVTPSISGNLVVWHHAAPDLPGPYVYGADISDPNHPRGFYTFMALGGYEIPSLSEGWLVARETDEVGKVMVDNLFDPFNPEGISSSGLTAAPRIHKHIVVWQDQSNGTSDIRAYNLVTRQEIVVTDMKMSDQLNPAVYVDTEHKRAIVVWQDDRNGNWDIYGAILDGPEAATEREQ